MMLAYGATHPGRRRENNEDAFLITPELHAAILADGMGGHSCGEVGSAITIETVAAYLAKPEAGLSPAEIAKEAIRAANQQVIESAKQRVECKGMGSTVVMALWRGASLTIANVGDSRAYLYRDGELRQLSYDQNFANELRTALGFSEERVRSLPNRNVLTMAVGTFEQVLVRIHSETLQAGDRVLLCSDGLYGPVDEAALREILDAHPQLEAAVQALVERANQNGGPDNVTAILLRYTDEAND